MFCGRSTLMVLMFSSLIISQRGSLRVARAFTTKSTSRVAHRAIVSSTVGQQQPVRSGNRLRKLSTHVEEDLDQALTSFLADSKTSTKKKIRVTSEWAEATPTREKASKLEPVSLSALIDEREDEEEVDYNDPKFLNTKNPFWIENGLDPRIIDILSEKGITQFTPVQAEAFLPVLRRRDVIGRSRTGTGKTLAFGLPALTRIADFLTAKKIRSESGQMQRGRGTSMLVLCPTRELARQVSEELSLVAKPLGLYVDVFHGGVSYEPQERALRQGLDVLVGTPGRVIDHIKRGNLDLSNCDLVVLDEADEMLNMGFAEDVEIILNGVGSANEKKSQCLLFSATTPSWVKQIGSQYQTNVYSIDATGNQGARVATTVVHKAIQLPPGIEAKKQALEDIIAVEISKNNEEDSDEEDDLAHNPIAAAAREKKKSSGQHMQQKIFGKTIVFTETKREADELVSGNVFKTLSAQAIHGDVGQKQRDATLNAFRKGAFNVLVATDVAARGIDISDVDLVIQFDPPRDVDTYVHRSGRTGRAGKSGTSVLLFTRQQARDIVRIERDLGHGFKFELAGPPSIEAAMRASAKTSANACMAISGAAVGYFREAAAELLLESEDPEEIVARCLAAISRRSTDIQSRSLITGELGFASVEMSYKTDKRVTPGDVMFTVGKLARMSSGDLKFDSDVGKIQTQAEEGTAIFDLGVEDAKRLVEFSKQEGVDTFGADFNLAEELEVSRDRLFGFGDRDNRRGSGGSGGNFGRSGQRSAGGVGYRGEQTGRRYQVNDGYRGSGGAVYKGRSERVGYSRADSGGYKGRSEGGVYKGRSDGAGYRDSKYRAGSRDESHRGYSNHENRREGRRFSTGSTGGDAGGW